MPNGQPPLPSRWRVNPVGGARLYRSASMKFAKAIRGLRRWLVDQVEQIPKQPVTNAQRYEYLIDALGLDWLLGQIDLHVDELPINVIIDAVMQAYETGTGEAVENLRTITDEYDRTLTQVLISASYQRRTALVGARVFEEMAGLQGVLKSELRRVLTRGVSDGMNPIDLAKTISERCDVSISRARRIARTEVTGALRRARWDEDQDANDRLGIKTKLLWMSALGATTRPHHASRHGKLYSRQEVREFYARDANAINCRCGQVSVLLDKNGNPVTPEIIERVRAVRGSEGDRTRQAA